MTLVNIPFPVSTPVNYGICSRKIIKNYECSTGNWLTNCIYHLVEENFIIFVYDDGDAIFKMYELFCRHGKSLMPDFVYAGVKIRNRLQHSCLNGASFFIKLDALNTSPHLKVIENALLMISKSSGKRRKAPNIPAIEHPIINNFLTTLFGDLSMYKRGLDRKALCSPDVEPLLYYINYQLISRSLLPQLKENKLSIRMLNRDFSRIRKNVLSMCKNDNELTIILPKLLLDVNHNQIMNNMLRFLEKYEKLVYNHKHQI